MFKKIFFTLAFVTLLISFTVVYATPVFNKKSEEITFYYGSNSSLSTEKAASGSAFSFNAYGECYKTGKDGASVSEILSEFGATLVFNERIEEGESFYAYSPRIRYLKVISGKRVNLHVFVGKTQITVGTPIIFGSF